MVSPITGKETAWDECPHCGADMGTYGLPQYCPECGLEQTYEGMPGNPGGVRVTCPAMNGSVKCEHYTGITRFNGGDYVLALCWYPHKANAAKFYEIDTRRAREVRECPLNTTAQNSKPLSAEGHTGLQSEELQ